MHTKLKRVNFEFRLNVSLCVWRGNLMFVYRYGFACVTLRAYPIHWHPKVYKKSLN